MLNFVAVKKEPKHQELTNRSVVYAFPEPIPLLFTDGKQAPDIDDETRFGMAPGFHLGIKPDEDDGLIDRDLRKRFLKRMTMKQFSSLTAEDFRSANINLRRKNGKLYFCIEVSLLTVLRVLDLPKGSTTKRTPA